MVKSTNLSHFKRPTSPTWGRPGHTVLAIVVYSVGISSLRVWTAARMHLCHATEQKEIRRRPQ